MLTVQPDMHEAVLAKAKERFMTPQEFFIDAARKELLKPKDAKRGRPPKKGRMEDLFTGKR